MAQHPTLLSLWLHALFYMLLVGGGWLVILPLLLLLLENQQLEVGVRSPPILFIGVALFVGGIVLALTAGYYLIVRGWVRLSRSIPRKS